MSTKEMREKRANLVSQAREIEKSARDAGREAMNEEETQRFDKFMDEVETLKQQIDRIERLEDAERALAESTGRKTEKGEKRADPTKAERRVIDASQAERGDAVRAWLLNGTNNHAPADMCERAARIGIDVDSKVLSFNLATRALKTLDAEGIREWEQRALTVGTGSSGGFTVPDEMMRTLEVALLRFGGMRQVSDIIRTASGAAMPWPTVNDTSQSGEILTENTQVNQQDVVFAQLILDAFKYSSKMILVPVELLQDSAVNIPEYLGEALGTRIGRITNTHFTTGDGSAKPRGVVTASSLGKTGGAGQTTSVTYADLVDLQHSVDPEYRSNARWMFHDLTLRNLKKLLDAENRPLWAPGIAVREPDTILGQPYVINQAVAQMAASAKSIIFGDFSKYKIRDVQDVILRRLDERFADFHQVAFLAFSRHDGDLLDAGTGPVKHYINAAA